MDKILNRALRSCRIALALLWCAALIPVRLEAQCTLASAPKSFEPNPPGVPRSATLLSSGFSNHLGIFQNGANGPRRLMMQESYGYSVLDISTPLNPIALLYHDLRIPVGGPNTVAAHGDGQSYVQTISASQDGARAAFSLSGPGVPPWNTVVGSTDVNNVGFSIWGDFPPNKASGTVIQQIGGRYIAYDTSPFFNATAIDVTNLPTFLDQSGSSMQGETTSWPAGGALSLAGNFVLFMAGSDIQVIDASSPGPPGSITGGMPKTAVTSADFGGRTPLNYAAAVDPNDPNKLWVLVELAAAAGQAAPSYGLVSLTKGFPSSAQSAGPLFDVPSSPGDFFSNVGYASTLIPSNGSLFVLMWTKHLPASGSSYEFRLYSTTAGAWASVPPSSFSVSAPGFGLTSAMQGFGDGTGAIYAYVPTTVAAYVIPMTCAAPNAAVSATVGNLVANDTRPVKSCQTGTLAECTVFLGDKITGSIAVIPSSSAQQPITGFNFDFDFHTGNPTEDAGAGIFPRIKNLDNTALGVTLGAPLPTSFTVVGPCDPNQSVGNAQVLTGTGCWASVKTNIPVGGPDFTGQETSATPCKQLTFAVEAANGFGSTGAGLSSLCWKVPTIRASSQILTGNPIDASGSDGRPTATGFLWYFGGNNTAPAGEALAVDGNCTGPTCPHSFAGKGVYNFWVKATYANGYASPDYCPPGSTICTPTSALLTVNVTDFVPKFLVNNSATDKMTVPVSAPTLSLTNQSIKGAGIAGAYSYAFCQDPCASWPSTASFTAWPAMTDSGSATVPNQVKGSWLLRVHVQYSGTASGGEDWTPNNPGAADPKDFRFNVTDVIPTISFKINNQNPCGGFGVCANPVVGDTITAFSTPADPAAAWDFSGANPPAVGSGQSAAFSYGAPGNYTVTLTQSGVVVTATVTVNPKPVAPPPSLSVSAFANPNPAPVNSNVTFTCNASGGTPPYSYSWSGAFPGSGPNVSVAFPSVGNYTAVCTATDSANASNTAPAFVQIATAAPPPATCAGGTFLINDTATGSEAQQTGGLGVFFYKATTGEGLTFVPSGTFTTTLWDFGDGSPTSTLAQPTHTYATPGQYAPSVVFDGNSASCRKARTIQIAGMSGAFSMAYADSTALDASQVTSGKPVKFFASEADDGSKTFAWDFGDGAKATEATPTHAFVAFGVNATYTVTLAVTKADQSASSSQVFTVIAPPDPPKWFVGGMAYTSGAIPGTVWQSDVTILNPHPTLTATYSIAFLDGSKAVDPKDLVYKTITLHPQESAESSNVLGAFFGLPLGSFGALIVRGDVAPIAPSITSRTFNNGDPAKGSFGLSVPPTQTLDGSLPAGLTAPQFLIGLRDDAASYTNIGLVNLVATDWSHAHLTFFDAAGATLGVLNVDVPPYGVAQLNKPLTKPKGADGLGLPASALYRTQVTVDAGGAVYPFATVIDATSTDPFIVTPTTAPATSYLIPGIVRQTGRNGEHFRSRVTVFNPSTSGRAVRLTLGYVLCDGDSCGPPSSLAGDVRMAGGQTQSWDDFVKVWFSAFNHSDVSDTQDYKFSWVDVRPAPGDEVTDPLIVLGETYNETPNGSAANGRVGFQIPGYTPADAAASASASTRLILTGLTSTAAYRTNIALFAVAGATTNWCTVHVFGADGTKLRDVPVQVPAFTSVSDSTLFGGLSGGPYSVVIDSIDAGVTVGGYATIIDNTSGDATFVKAQPVP